MAGGLDLESLLVSHSLGVRLEASLEDDGVAGADRALVQGFLGFDGVGTGVRGGNEACEWSES